MTRKTFEIVLVILGIILGSLATINTSIVPTRVTVTTNQDAKVRIKNGGSYVDTINFTGKSTLPIHQENGVFYYSSTLSMDDLVSGTSDSSENYIYYSSEISVDKAIDNAYLQIDMEVTGDDAMNGALRIMAECGKLRYTLSVDEPSVVTDIALATTGKVVTFYIYYELDDADCTIDNINAAEGADVSIKLYANVIE